MLVFDNERLHCLLGSQLQLFPRCFRPQLSYCLGRSSHGLGLLVGIFDLVGQGIINYLLDFLPSPPGSETFLRCRLHKLPDHCATLSKVQPGQGLDDLFVHLQLHLLRGVIGQRSQRILNPLRLPLLSALLFLNLSLLPSLLMPLFLQPSPALVLPVFLLLIPPAEEIHFLFDLAANTQLL